jgi:hypothetical protein
VTFSGGGGSGAAAYATVGTTPIVKSLGGAISFYTAGGEQARVIDVPAANRYIEITGGLAGSSSPGIGTGGTEALDIYSRTNAIWLATNGKRTTVQAAVAHTASAVNYVQVTGAATGGRTKLSSTGSDATVGMVLDTKGSGTVVVTTNGSGVTSFEIAPTNSPANYLRAASTATTVGPILSAQGTDTNIDLTLTPKGTGNVVASTGAFSGTHIGTWTGSAIGVAYGGTGLTSTPANGALDIGNGTGFTRTTLTPGSGISITNGAGSITIAASGSGVTSVTGTAPVVSSGGSTPAISLASGYGDTQNPFASKTANYFLAAPNGSAGAPTFRAIVAADIPTLNQNTTGSAASATTFTSTTQNSQFNSIGVGTAGSGTAGEIRATNNITAYYSSDVRFKENITPIAGASEIVRAIGADYFDWTDAYVAEHGGEDGYFVQKADFGVIAQKVLTVFPRAVRKRPDGSLAVDYEKLGVLAFPALVETMDRLNALEARLAALEK